MSAHSESCHEHFAALTKFFLTFSLVYLFYQVSGEADEYIDYLLCRNCGHELVHPSSLIRVPSKLAVRQRNETISGKPEVLIQLFKNPDDVHFEVITAHTVTSVESKESYDTMTWFSGYNWRFCVCPICHRHIGWKYETDQEKEGVPSKFYGIILANVLQQSDECRVHNSVIRTNRMENKVTNMTLESESIIHIPKAYRS